MVTFKQSIKAINDASNDTRLTIVERGFYKWLSTQNRHRHLFIFKKPWRGSISFKINQKYKR